LSKGKSWEGVCLARKKNGEQFVQCLKIVPFLGSNGIVTHHVVIKRDISALQQNAEIQQMHQELHKACTTSTVEKGLRDHFEKFQSVLVQTHAQSASYPADTPIQQVIKMLNAIQENSPHNVVQVLDEIIVSLFCIFHFTSSFLI
jgi:high affinity cAMP-specific and IBMX-insensitive 3',5'-cyclic phosphodiesterase 8